MIPDYHFIFEVSHIEDKPISGQQRAASVYLRIRVKPADKTDEWKSNYRAVRMSMLAMMSYKSGHVSYYKIFCNWSWNQFFLI